jgi:outer membrane lipoprotein carrier protein
MPADEKQTKISCSASIYSHPLTTNKVRLICLLAVLVASSWAAATAQSTGSDVRSIAAAVDNHYNHLRSLQAEFTEIYRGNGMDRTESGTLWLKKPRKMRWEYRSPKEKLFLTDGHDAWFYVPGEHQVRKESFKKLEDLRSPLGFLLGKTKLDKELEGLSLASDRTPVKPGNLVLRGVPKGMKDRINQVLLEITADSRIVRIEMEEADGGITQYEFQEQKENVPVEDARFRFNPPPGVETIEGALGQ